MNPLHILINIASVEENFLHESLVWILNMLPKGWNWQTRHSQTTTLHLYQSFPTVKTRQLDFFLNQPNSALQLLDRLLQEKVAIMQLTGRQLTRATPHGACDHYVHFELNFISGHYSLKLLFLASFSLAITILVFLQSLQLPGTVLSLCHTTSYQEGYSTSTTPGI